MIRSIVRRFPALLFVAASVACQGGRQASEETVQSLRRQLESKALPAYLSSDPQGPALWKTARAFYERQGYQPVWIEGSRPGDAAADLLAAVDGVRAEGLDPADYDLGPTAEMLNGRSRNPFKRSALKPEQVAEAELRLTGTFLKLASHLLTGRVEPAAVDSHWFGQRRQVDLGAVLDRALGGTGVAPALHGLAPQHEQYALLKETLQKYGEIEQRGGWPTNVRTRLKLRDGVRDPGVVVLRRRLAATGELPAEAGSSDVVDAALIEAVKRFERRHGLPEDGALDAEAVRALNVPVSDRVRQIELNLERWRWLPESFGDRYVLVNVPTFTLTAVDGGQPALVMRVVAGEKENPTPIFSDQMTTVVFSPYWNIPETIARKETIPAVLRDPEYLRKNDLELVRGSQVVHPASVDWTEDDPDFRIRQRPGARNSLGQVKFMFPNQFDVYLHDTPADSLFNAAQRGFSHGCVRVERPRALAQWVLAGQAEWTPEKIDAAMRSGQEQHVALARKVPVYIVYQTVWVDGDGIVHFATDLYGHDERQLGLIAPAAPRPPAPRVAQR
jgi:murein L,D-transpeptidase YcbB/YkuD